MKILLCLILTLAYTSAFAQRGKNNKKAKFPITSNSKSKKLIKPEASKTESKEIKSAIFKLINAHLKCT